MKKTKEPTQKEKNIDKKDSKLTTFLLMFTLEGHTTWRQNFFPTKEAFDVYLSKNPNHPKVTAKKWFIVDRITGDITEEK